MKKIRIRGPDRLKKRFINLLFNDQALCQNNWNNLLVNTDNTHTTSSLNDSSIAVANSAYSFFFLNTCSDYKLYTSILYSLTVVSDYILYFFGLNPDYLSYSFISNNILCLSVLNYPSVYLSLNHSRFVNHDISHSDIINPSNLVSVINNCFNSVSNIVFSFISNLYYIPYHSSRSIPITDNLSPNLDC